jgi:hypothetical protein
LPYTIGSIARNAFIDCTMLSGICRITTMNTDGANVRVLTHDTQLGNQ